MALLPGSPARGAGGGGSPEELGACEALDQRGVRRPGNATEPGASECDLGAYETSSCLDGVVDSERGEECDDGVGSASSCCNRDCTLKTAGTVCRQAVGGCDVAETCSGTAAACPADLLAPAGAICSYESDQSTQDVCDGAGACVGTTEAGCEGGAVCTPSDENEPPSPCDDTDACTADSFDPRLGCRHEPLDPTTPDGVFCLLENVETFLAAEAASARHVRVVRRLDKAVTRIGRLLVRGTEATRATRCRRKLVQSSKQADRLRKRIGRVLQTGKLDSAERGDGVQRELEALRDRARRLARSACAA